MMSHGFGVVLDYQRMLIAWSGRRPRRVPAVFGTDGGAGANTLVLRASATVEILYWFAECSSR